MMKIHKCQGTEKNQVSIMFSKVHPELNILNDEETWRLFCPAYINYTSNNIYAKHITPIQYCPFCGINLNSNDNIIED